MIKNFICFKFFPFQSHPHVENYDNYSPVLHFYFPYALLIDLVKSLDKIHQDVSKLSVILSVLVCSNRFYFSNKILRNPWFVILTL